MHTDLLNENRIDKAVRLALYLLFGLLPWVSLPLGVFGSSDLGIPTSWSSPFYHVLLPADRVGGMHGKFTLIALLASWIFFLWIAKVLATSELRIVRTPLDGTIVIFVFAVMVSTLFSDDIAKALLGWDRHREGLVAFSIYALAYFAVVNFIDGEEHLENLILALSAGLAASIFQAVFQIAAGRTEFGNRVTASFTDPNFYAAFLLMAIPLVLAFASYSKKVWVKLSLVSLGASSLVILLFTFSRIAYIASVFSLLFACVFLWLGGKGRRALKYSAAALVIFAALLALSISTSSASEFYFIKRVSISSFAEGLRARTGLWRLAWSYVFDRPLFGYGPDRYRFATGNAGGYGGAHNEYIYYIVTLGWVGFASFLLLVAKYLVHAVRHALKKDRFLSLRIGCLTGVAGYLLYIHATYSIPYVAIFFWLLLAVTWLPEIFKHRSTLCIRLKPLPDWAKVAGFLLSAAAVLFVMVQVLRLPMGAIYWSEGKVLWANGEKDSAVIASQRAVRFVPDSEPYWTDFGGQALYLAKHGRQDLIPVAVLSFEKVVSQLNKGESAPWFYLGEAYRLSGNEEKANRAYEKAIELGTSDPLVRKATVILGEKYER